MQVSTEHQPIGIELLRQLADQRTTIVGIGNMLRADDGAGPAICSRIKGLVAAEVIDAGPVPENFLGPIVRTRPDDLVIIDTAELGLSPGAIRVLSATDLRSCAVSTHCCSLELFVRLIAHAVKDKIYLIGIQPACLTFGSPVSCQVQEAIEYLSQILCCVFTKRHQGP